MTSSVPPASKANRPLSLPLTEPAASLDASFVIDVQLIRTIVHAFYSAIRDDDLIGPIFMQRVHHWPTHLQKMCDFWSTIVLRTGRYSGRPLEMHAEITELRKVHFERWLEAWSETLQVHAPADAYEAFMAPAHRMARAMQSPTPD